MIENDMIEIEMNVIEAGKKHYFNFRERYHRTSGNFRGYDNKREGVVNRDFDNKRDFRDNRDRKEQTSFNRDRDDRNKNDYDQKNNEIKDLKINDDGWNVNN